MQHPNKKRLQHTSENRPNILKKRLQHAFETLATYATSPIYFCNIKMKQLQHTSETSETNETYIGNIGEGKAEAGRFQPPGSEPAMSVGT